MPSKESTIDLSKASVHDINYLKDIKPLYRDCSIFGNKEYIGAEVQLDLFEAADIGQAIKSHSSRARAYTLYSLCFLPSRLHRLGEMLVIQCVVGEGKGKICLHRKEIGPRLGGKTLFCCALILRRLRKTVKAVKEKCRGIV